MGLQTAHLKSFSLFHHVAVASLSFESLIISSCKGGKGCVPNVGGTQELLENHDFKFAATLPRIITLSALSEKTLSKHRKKRL